MLRMQRVNLRLTLGQLYRPWPGDAPGDRPKFWGCHCHYPRPITQRGRGDPELRGGRGRPQRAQLLLPSGLTRVFRWAGHHLGIRDSQIGRVIDQGLIRCSSQIIGLGRCGQGDIEFRSRLVGKTGEYGIDQPEGPAQR